MLTFIFLLVVARIFSQVSTKCEKQVEELLLEWIDIIHIHHPLLLEKYQY